MKHWWGKICLFVVMIVAAGLRTNAQITVSPDHTALALAQKLAGPGITILSPVLTCPSLSNGFFTVTAGAPGMDSGIVLTTGRALSSGSSYGVNGSASLNASFDNGAPGDPDLAALANNTTLNACTLEFDLQAKGDSVRFQYVFASEEYNNSTCGIYNDAFAFFISGPGISGTENMALVPGTNIPVTVNTINDGIPGSLGTLSNCTSMGAGSPFTAYYLSNLGGTSMTYRGLTTVLTARHAVVPCSTYHLKMSIADAGNALYDSAVFLRAGSLNAGLFTLTAQGFDPSTNIVVKDCQPGNFIVHTPAPSPVNQIIHFQLSGNAINGIDNSMIADSVVLAAGDTTVSISVQSLVAGSSVKDLRLYLLSPYNCDGNTVVDSADILLYPARSVSILTADTTICAGDTLSILASGDLFSQYDWSPAIGLSDAHILDPVLLANTSASYVLTNSFALSGCPDIHDTLRVTVNQAPAVNAGPDQLLCVHTQLSLAGSATGSTDVFFTTPSGAMVPGSNISIADALASDSGIYILTAIADGCRPATDSVLAAVGNVITAPEVTSPAGACQNSMAMPLTANGDNLLWYSNSTGGIGDTASPIPVTFSLGTFSYFVSRSSGSCESPRAEIDVVVRLCCEDYLFIPSAFTPNNDGRNDFFHPVKGVENAIEKFQIYDRWGSLIYQGYGNDEWDGAGAEVGTYYYRIIMQCEGHTIERNGDVLLIR